MEEHQCSLDMKSSELEVAGVRIACGKGNPIVEVGRVGCALSVTVPPVTEKLVWAYVENPSCGDKYIVEPSEGFEESSLLKVAASLHCVVQDMIRITVMIGLDWLVGMSMSRHNLSSPSCSPSTPNDNPDADLETPNDTDCAADSETTPVSTNRITYPRFLVAEGLHPKKTFRNVNRTILTKTIEGATSTTTKKQWMGKLVLVEVRHFSQIFSSLYAIHAV